MNYFVLGAAALIVSGCASTQTEPQPPAPPPAPKVVGDSFCSASSQQDYSVNDTPQTIDGIRQRNAGYKKRCEDKQGG